MKNELMCFWKEKMIETFGIDIEDIREITFSRTTKYIKDSDDAIDLSYDEDGSVLGFISSRWTRNCDDRKFVAITIAADGGVKAPVYSTDLFAGLKMLKYIHDIHNLDTSEVAIMDGMFYDCLCLHELDLSYFNTENVVDMSYMFTGCKNLEVLNFITFKTDNVESMRAMFQDCENLVAIRNFNFNTKNVTNFASMFDGCGLEKIDVSGFNFNEDVNVYNMFRYCTNIIYDKKYENILSEYIPVYSSISSIDVMKQNDDLSDNYESDEIIEF